MNETTYKLKDGRCVVIEVDVFDYGVTIRAGPSDHRVGYMTFRFIEMPPGCHDHLHLTHAFLDQVDRSYLYHGIGRRCLALVREFSGLSITASEDDGFSRADGSHLTGDAGGFVARMREEGLIAGGRQEDCD